MSRENMSPEERASADLCDQFTDAILANTQGMPVGVVLGACMNVIRHAATFLPADMRKTLAERLRNEFAGDIEALQDTPQEQEPGSYSASVVIPPVKH